MGSRRYGFEYDGQPIFERVDGRAPVSEHPSASDDFFVYVMGPYTAFDATLAYDDGHRLESPFIDDPLFDPDEHVTDGTPDMEAALGDLCGDLRTRFGVRAFIATDIGIPTRRQADEQGLDEPGMTPLDQSVAYAAVSDAVAFVFSVAGLTTGVGAEAGAILGEFGLRSDSPRRPRKPRERLRLFCGPGFGSATVDEIPLGFGVDRIDFESRADLVRKLHRFLTGVERADRHLPVFVPYE